MDYVGNVLEQTPTRKWGEKVLEKQQQNQNKQIYLILERTGEKI